LSPPDARLDEHLQALFAGLDTGAGFDARLMARVRAESHSEASGRALRARQQERARHRQAVLQLRSAQRSLLQRLTLDTLGIALVLALAGSSAWPHFGRNVVEIWRAYGVYLVILLSLLIGAVPLAAMWAEQTRRPLRLL
jgi:hypothetical protein